MTVEALAPARPPRISRLGTRLEKAIPADVVRFRFDDRASWLALREPDVTASVAAAVVGEHPYQTRLGLYALKTGQAADSEVEPIIEENSISLPPMLRGTVLEPVVPKLIGMMRPLWEIEPCDWYYREPAARIGATPDLIAIDPDRGELGVIQVKTTDHRTFRKIWKREDGSVEPPLFIVIQAIIEATLTGASWAAVAVMVSGSTLDLHLIDIPIHAGIMKRLRAEVAEFWRRVAAGEPPEADYGRDAEVLAALYREDNGQEIDLSGDNQLPERLARRDELLAERRTTDDEIERINTELKDRLGPNEAALVAGGRRITWRTERRKQRFVPQSETRVLRVSAPR